MNKRFWRDRRPAWFCWDRCPAGWSFTFAVAALVVFCFHSSVSAIGFGEVEVVAEPVPPGESDHGYMELGFRITNRSKESAHEIKLTLPQHSYSHYYEDYLRAVTRTVRVAPGETARVSLLYPARIRVGGELLGVTIDGKEEKDGLSFDSSRRSGRYSSPSGGRTGAMVLFSQGVDVRFPDWIRQNRFVGIPEFGPEIAPRPREKGKKFDPDDPAPEPMMIPPPPAGFTVTNLPEFIRSPAAAANWSTNWLGYSRFDGLILTADELRSLQADVRSAIGQYVECGGTLLIIGRDPQLPGNWKLTKWQDGSGAECEAGFGTCCVIYSIDFAEPPSPFVQRIQSMWSKSQRPWGKQRSEAQANTEFPIVEDVGVPVLGLLGLMLLFSIVAGPVCLAVLNRRGRKLWIFWVIPLISAFTCLCVFGYIAVSEGWTGKSRIMGLTILDENTHRASSIGWSAFYSPVSASNGLHFSTATEASLQSDDDFDSYHYRRRSSSSSALSMDWTNEQHLVSGWISPRVPVHFVIRKSEVRRERVTFSRRADGSPEAVNGLGADLTELWYCDESGKLFSAKNVPAGAKVSLAPAERSASRTVRSIGEIYVQDWSALPKLISNIPSILKPKTYFAVMQSAPFFDEGLPKAKPYQSQSMVIGIIKEGADEN